MPYVHPVSHNLKKIGRKHGVDVVLTAPCKLAKLCSKEFSDLLRRSVSAVSVITLDDKCIWGTKLGLYTCSQVKEGILPLDNETVVDRTRSNCSSPLGEQTLVLLFGNNSLSLVFAKNATVYLHKVFVDFFFTSELFPNASKPEEHLTVYNDTLMLYSVPEERSYHCKVDQPVYIGANVTLDVLSVQLQAFRNTTSEAAGQFGDAVECSAGDISNIVPIAVGSALAALVIIVLIAYLIGRSKSRQKGYQSV
ncbi:lysosome-associated membrane glycoprotein 1-like [Rhipicephalus sanguineus]|uniref:lysosome-associated membrane glycoprotein 1-like n=1 Tax=Rhipicephalus sanguineus TaxID=34632 RepID=UPI0020C41F86|nr:lysosome-associated membrane glycoprotein 1-like [Rhipicephalus sanguineus]